MDAYIIGKLIVKYDTQPVSDKFRKREFVLETLKKIHDNIYTNYAVLQLVQDKCELLDNYEIGKWIQVWYNIKGNRWERDGIVKYQSNLDAWKIERSSEEYG